MMHRVAVLSLFILVPVAVAAQDPDAPSVGATLSLEDALRIARSNNATFQQAANDEGPANWGVRDAYASFLPSFTLNGSMGYRGPGTQTFLTTTFRQSSATVSSTYSAQFNWQMNGQIWTAPGLERAQRDAVVADIGSAERNLEVQVTQQYLAVLQAQANLELQRRQVERNEENLRLAQGRFEVGQVTRMDVSQAQVAKGQSEVELLRLEQLVRIEQLRLFRLLGVDPPADIMAVELVDEFEVTEPDWDLQTLQSLMENRHPDLVALRKREAAAKWQARSARARFLPTLSINAGWAGFTQQFTDVDPLVQSTLQSERNSAMAAMSECETQNQVFMRLTDPLPTRDCSQFVFTDSDAAELASAIRSNNDVFPFDFTPQPFQASLFISYPIFSGFDRAASISQAEAAREDADLAARDRELALRAEVAQRFYEVQRQYQTVEIQESNRTSAQDQLDLASERYRLGQGSFFELLEAQLLFQTAERDRVNAVYDYHRAVAQLEAAVGMPLR